MIVIFGMPRTGTHALQLSIAHHFKIQNHGELFGIKGKVNNLDQAGAWFDNNNSGVVKILAGQSGITDLGTIESAIFKNHIVISDRLDLVESCVSLYYASQSNQYHYSKRRKQRNTTKFTIPAEWVEGWVNGNLIPFRQTVDRWTAAGLKFSRVVYEDLIADKNITVVESTFKLSDFADLPTDPSNIDYGNLCLNYKEIQAQINAALGVKI